MLMQLLQLAPAPRLLIFGATNIMYARLLSLVEIKASSSNSEKLDEFIAALSPHRRHCCLA